eukprot:936969-Prorocentrum_minimum.AAC.1
MLSDRSQQQLVEAGVFEGAQRLGHVKAGHAHAQLPPGLVHVAVRHRRHLMASQRAKRSGV